MKKRMAMLMGIVLVLALGISAAAEGEVKNPSQDVTAKYEKKTPVVYSVDVSWGNMAYTYTVTETWDPATHQTTQSGAWSCETGADQITVTNHSNAEVNVTLSYEAKEDYAGISGSFDDNDTFKLATAVETEYSSAPSGTATLALSGSLSASETAVTVGTVTVSLGGETQ